MHLCCVCKYFCEIDPLVNVGRKEKQWVYGQAWNVCACWHKQNKAQTSNQDNNDFWPLHVAQAVQSIFYIAALVNIGTKEKQCVNAYARNGLLLNVCVGMNTPCHCAWKANKKMLNKPPWTSHADHLKFKTESRSAQMPVELSTQWLLIPNTETHSFKPWAESACVMSSVKTLFCSVILQPHHNEQHCGMAVE